MTNITMTTKGTTLTIVVDLAKTFGRSKSGKTEIIATTGGNVSVTNHPEIKVGLNIYK